MGSLIESNDSHHHFLGWLTFRPDTQEFFYSHKSGNGCCDNAYVKDTYQRQTMAKNSHADKIQSLLQ